MGLVLTWTAMESLTTESPLPAPLSTDPASGADTDGPGPPLLVPEPLASMLMVMESLTTMLEPAASTVQELASADTPDTAGAEDSSDRTDRPKRKTNIH